MYKSNHIISNRFVILNFIRCYKKNISPNYIHKINTVHKRASMLANMYVNRDKRKTWHFEILQNNAKSKNVFEKVSRPHRRQNVLNSLFIRNISDVLSTGDVAPEILGCGVEITGVKVSPCCKILNVFWQVPTSSESSDMDIALILNQHAPKLRAELISRNVMGRVPNIFFIRDLTNAYISEFEKAMKEIDLGPDPQSAVVPDDSFVNDIYKFRKPSEDKKEKFSKTTTIQPTDCEEAQQTLPQKPQNMKTDVFGINHKYLMDKVIAMKTKPKCIPTGNTIVTSIGDPNSIDLFSNIPGTTFYQDVDRDELLKKFCVSRKKLMNKKTYMEYEDELECANYFEEESEVEPFTIDDFLEEDSTEKI